MRHRSVFIAALAHVAGMAPPPPASTTTPDVKSNKPIEPGPRKYNPRGYPALRDLSSKKGRRRR